MRILTLVKEVGHGAFGRTEVSVHLDEFPLITNREYDGLALECVAAPETGNIHAIREHLGFGGALVLHKEGALLVVIGDFG